MGANLWGGKSPVQVPTWTRHESKDNHEPKGRIVEEGAHEALLQMPRGLYAHL